MNKQEAIEQMDLLNKEMEKLRKIIEEPDSKIWRPEFDEEFYFISDKGTISDDTWYDTDADKSKFALNNVFKTIEEAEFEFEKQLVEAELRICALENNDEVDWNDEGSDKYYIEYNYKTDTMEYDCYSSYQAQGAIHFTSEEIIERAIDQIGEDRIKKYIFGIE